MTDLKSEITEFARSESASLVGVASVDRFHGAPEGHGPLDFVEEAKSVIVLGIKVPDTIVEYSKYVLQFRGKPWWASAPVPPINWITSLKDNVYMLLGHYTIDLMLDRLAVRIALKLEDAGYRSMPIPCGSWTGLDKPVAPLTNWFAPFSHRHAAVRAGLGEFGFNNIVLSPQFGPRFRPVSIITEAPLEPDPLISEKVCLREKCSAQGPHCLQACHAGAIRLQDGIDHNAIFIDTPSQTDARLCWIMPPGENLGHWGGYHACIYYGQCMAVCPVGAKRGRQRVTGRSK
ncbi:hypothetical protein ACFLW4_03945 [Chloroflexota bacterium]